jgi:hypothetical protein
LIQGHQAAAKSGGGTNDVVDLIIGSGLFEAVRFKLFVELRLLIVSAVVKESLMVPVDIR